MEVCPKVCAWPTALASCAAPAGWDDGSRTVLSLGTGDVGEFTSAGEPAHTVAPVFDDAPLAVTFMNVSSASWQAIKY